MCPYAARLDGPGSASDVPHAARPAGPHAACLDDGHLDDPRAAHLGDGYAPADGHLIRQARPRRPDGVSSFSAS